MLHVPPVTLPTTPAAALLSLQADIDALPTFAERVAAAKTRFSSKNRKGDTTFDAIKEVLTAMCAGRCRCMYCEDSAADEVEHFRPKDLYPEVVFAWINYLYACGPCNGPKNNRFQVLSAKSRTIVDVTRPLKAPVTEPEPGDPVLIDPRREDPLTLMRLDIRGTFLFRPIPSKGTHEYERANYTINILHLNERDHLPGARKDAYEAYCALLHRYVLKKKASASAEYLARTESALRRTHHPTVWAEMKRQRDEIPELRALFREAPEAMQW
ncbi:hypothetical protein [Sorangium atrum]|uniref:HNH nuclease domain-containing protein n=1 Tax=Sorangium atrum TaxID=2995308 RepID=A0ABT5CIY0_9BACT|nr:hypothetical protein [Sorangium aterium]MDC0685598.1 hypothetical protein [Sorangium aterium]